MERNSLVNFRFSGLISNSPSSLLLAVAVVNKEVDGRPQTLSGGRMDNVDGVVNPSTKPASKTSEQQIEVAIIFMMVVLLAS
jgi:hypothetical protein